MAGTSDSPQNDDVVEGWRMALLLLGFATMTLLLELFFKFLESVVKQRKGLSVALYHIKNELLYVGFISLLLSAFQNLLAKICMPITDIGPYDRRRNFRRHLLAAAKVDYCAPNGQSLWPVTLQHDTHIFIFVVAITHVLYGTLTVYLTLFRVKAWLKWEVGAREQGKTGDCTVMRIPAKWIYRHWGSNAVFHWAIMIVRQFYVSVNQTLYHNARLLFIEKMKLPLDYDFHAVVVTGLEDQLMHTLHPEWYMWLIAVVWYAIPRHAYVSYWMYGISLTVTLVIGGKLVDILVQISLQVAVKYGNSVVYGRMKSVPRANSSVLDKLNRMSLRNGPRPAANPDIERRFLERANDRRTAAAVGSGSAGATGNGDEGARPDDTRPSYTVATVVEALSSREQAKQVLRSWGDAASRSLNAALRSVRSGSRCASGGSGDADGDASTRPSIELGLAVEGPSDPSVPAAEMPSAMTERRHSSLARGSAPAAFRRQGLARFSSGRGLRASGDGGGGGGDNGVGEGGGSEEAHIAADTQPKRGRVHRLLSVILESTSPSRHSRTRNAPHEHHHHAHQHNHHHNRNHQHNHHNHDNRHQNRTNHIEMERTQKGTAASSTAAFSPDAATTTVESPVVSATTPARRASHEGRGVTRGLRSVFEQFQRHHGHHHDTLMLRRFFHPVAHHQPHASSDSPTMPCSNPPTAQQQEQQQPQPIARQPAAPAPAPATTALTAPTVAPAPADVVVTTPESPFATEARGTLDRRPGLPTTATALAKTTTSNGSSAAAYLSVPDDPASSYASVCIVTDDDDVRPSHNGVTRVVSGRGNNRGEPGQGGLEIEAVPRKTPSSRQLQKTRSQRHGEVPLKVQEGAASPSPGPARLTNPSEELTDAADGAPQGPPLALQHTASSQQSGSISSHRRRNSSWEEGSAGCGLLRAGGGAGLRLSSLCKGMRTNSGRRHVPLWKRPCYCGAKFTLNPAEYVANVILRNRERIQQSDTRDFFWFGQPNFLIGLFALAYFQNSLSIAICIFTLAGFYQAKTTWDGVSTWVVVLQLVLDLLLVPVVSLCVLPLYALIQPSGSHCPREVLEEVVVRASLARTQGRGLGRLSGDLRGVVRGIKAALARSSLGARGGSATAGRANKRLQKVGGVATQRSLSGPNLDAGTRAGQGS